MKKFTTLLCSAILFATHIATPYAAFAQTPQNNIPIIEVPTSLQGVKESSTKVGDEVTKGLVAIIPTIWNTQVVPVWKAMWEWTKHDVWENRLQPAVQQIVDQGKRLLGREVEQRKPIIQQQLEEEKQKAKEELQAQGAHVTKTLWERFLDLFRSDTTM